MQTNRITNGKQASAITHERDTELNGEPVGLTAVFLILALAAIVLAVAAEDAGDAATGAGAFELARKAHVDV